MQWSWHGIGNTTNSHIGKPADTFSEQSRKRRHNVLTNLSSLHGQLASILVEELSFFQRVLRWYHFSLFFLLRLLRNAFIFTPELVGKMKSDAILMHPLPRVNEIVQAVDALPQAKYFEQAINGVPVRMTLIAEVLGK